MLLPEIHHSLPLVWAVIQQLNIVVFLGKQMNKFYIFLIISDSQKLAKFKKIQYFFSQLVSKQYIYSISKGLANLICFSHGV